MRRRAAEGTLQYNAVVAMPVASRLPPGLGSECDHEGISCRQLPIVSCFHATAGALVAAIVTAAGVCRARVAQARISTPAIPFGGLLRAEQVRFDGCFTPDIGHQDAALLRVG